MKRFLSVCMLLLFCTVLVSVGHGSVGPPIKQNNEVIKSNLELHSSFSVNQEAVSISKMELYDVISIKDADNDVVCSNDNLTITSMPVNESIIQLNEVAIARCRAVIISISYSNYTKINACSNHPNKKLSLSFGYNKPINYGSINKLLSC